MTLTVGEVIGGRYKIVEKIGIGGMATVYRAEDLKLDRSVTLKVLKEEYTGDPDFKERFKTEAKSAAKLSHPNIVNVYDVGEDIGISYIVMEYIHGDSLKQIISSSAPFDTVATLSIAGQIASALNHAHNNGVVHRDIKPHNILVSVDGTIKVTDFGIARVAAVSTATTTSTALGSVYYLSPEQARGGYVDFKSDIYSLGITMYEMATGKVPYDGDTSVSIALQHINKDLPDIKKYNPEASDILQKIIRKATKKKKDDRYSSAALLLEDLKTALSEMGRSGVKKTSVDIIDAKEEKQVENSKSPERKAAFVDHDSSDVTKEEVKNEELGQDVDGIKVEISKKERNYDLPERSVGFDMYNKKLKISKEDDNFESEVYNNTSRRVQKAQTTASSSSGRKSSGKPQKKRTIENDGDDKYYKEKERQITIAAIVTACIIIAIITFFGSRMLTGSGTISTVSTSSMPLVVGMTLEEAQNETKDLKITIEVESEEYSNEHAEGLITKQTIPEGTSVSNGDVIKVVVSLGSQAFTMPDVVYEEEASAIKKIKNLGGSTPTVEYVFDDAVPAGLVVEQSPLAQSKVDSGSGISLKVSKGAETPTVTVPNFVGMKLSDAQKLMTEKGLILGTVTENNNVDGEKDKIISQSLTENQEVDRDTKIDFVVVGSKITEDVQTPENNETPDAPPASNDTKSFSVSTPQSFVDENNISVKVLQITNGNSVSVVYDEVKSISDFPFNVTVSGAGQVEVQLYIDNVYQWSQNVDFTEGGN